MKAKAYLNPFKNLVFILCLLLNRMCKKADWIKFVVILTLIWHTIADKSVLIIKYWKSLQTRRETTLEWMVNENFWYILCNLSKIVFLEVQWTIWRGSVKVEKGEKQTGSFGIKYRGIIENMYSPSQYLGISWMER